MAQSSISFDDVLGLLRGSAVQQFETRYVADRGYALHESWGNSQDMTRHLQLAQITRDWIERTLVSRGDLVSRFWDGVQKSEPADSSEEKIVLMRGFSIWAACQFWFLEERTDAELLSWLKGRRILNHKKYAKDLRTLFSQL